MENSGYWVLPDGTQLFCEDSHHDSVVMAYYRSKLNTRQDNLFRQRIFFDDTPSKNEWCAAGLDPDDYEYFTIPEDSWLLLPRWAIEHGWVRIVSLGEAGDDTGASIDSEEQPPSWVWTDAKRHWESVAGDVGLLRTPVSVAWGGKFVYLEKGIAGSMRIGEVDRWLKKHGTRI